MSNLGVKMDSVFKLDSQISAVVKSNFFHLRQLAKVKPFLSHHNINILVQVIITTHLDYCNVLYSGLNQTSLSRLQLVKNTAVRFSTGSRKL